MSLYATLEEAVDAAREEFLEKIAETSSDDESPSVSQFTLQKYIMQDGDAMWEAEFSAEEGEETEGLSFLSGEAAQAIFDDDFDKQELLEEWQDENTLYEWDEGEYLLEPPLDTEEGAAAAEEWDDEDEFPGRED
ncbi:MysB family protein [Rouxiella badensis]|jgi:acidic protein MsyB|uniref:SecY/secA suppressor protein n=1 Tax=Rouxiella badensis TaxID=1646377 RepID=A0A1X0WG97_9GAMM|nr:MysB family protein [Rouxiella badensis]MCC3701235.1 secY/secA suppressor protein [Rouxiella badensis]MCC3717662.1 secY/secA suppressor protein [Rouxiella badensis]MCC3727394.1 secY/secA suppressor protein [Rouxiella badensis]MCC3732659.1 secY/secA suppressor protein [Rouxiella badensis]MCC3739005.1 secY/secA suppressor protein [Rouxiella badensis]